MNVHFTKFCKLRPRAASRLIVKEAGLDDDAQVILSDDRVQMENVQAQVLLTQPVLLKLCVRNN